MTNDENPWRNCKLQRLDAGAVRSRTPTFPAQPLHEEGLLGVLQSRGSDRILQGQTALAAQMRLSSLGYFTNSLLNTTNFITTFFPAF